MFPVLDVLITSLFQPFINEFNIPIKYIRIHYFNLDMTFYSAPALNQGVGIHTWN